MPSTGRQHGSSGRRTGTEVLVQQLLGHLLPQWQLIHRLQGLHQGSDLVVVELLAATLPSAPDFALPEQAQRVGALAFEHRSERLPAVSERFSS